MMRTMATERTRQTKQAGAAALPLRERVQATICYGMHFCRSHTTTEGNSSLKFQILRSVLQTQVMGEVREVRKEEQEGKQRWEPGGENDSKARVRVVKALTNGPIATPVPLLAADKEQGITAKLCTSMSPNSSDTRLDSLWKNNQSRPQTASSVSSHR